MTQKRNNDDDFLLPFLVLSEMEREERDMNNEPGNNTVGIVFLLALIILISMCCNSGFLLGI